MFIAKLIVFYGKFIIKLSIGDISKVIIVSSKGRP